MAGRGLAVSRNRSPASCEPVSGSASNHFQEEERPTPQLGAFGLKRARPETTWRHAATLTHGITSLLTQSKEYKNFRDRMVADAVAANASPALNSLLLGKRTAKLAKMAFPYFEAARICRTKLMIRSEISYSAKQ